MPDNLEELQRELARVVAEKNMLEADAARRAGEIQSSPSPCDREGEGTACAVEAQMQVASWSAGDESDDESEETPVLCIGRHSWGSRYCDLIAVLRARNQELGQELNSMRLLCEQENLSRQEDIEAEAKRVAALESRNAALVQDVKHEWEERKREEAERDSERMAWALEKETQRQRESERDRIREEQTQKLLDEIATLRSDLHREREDRADERKKHSEQHEHAEAEKSALLQQVVHLSADRDRLLAEKEGMEEQRAVEKDREALVRREISERLAESEKQRKSTEERVEALVREHHNTLNELLSSATTEKKQLEEEKEEIKMRLEGEQELMLAAEQAYVQVLLEEAAAVKEHLEPENDRSQPEMTSESSELFQHNVPVCGVSTQVKDTLTQFSGTQTVRSEMEKARAKLRDKMHDLATKVVLREQELTLMKESMASVVMERGQLQHEKDGLEKEVEKLKAENAISREQATESKRMLAEIHDSHAEEVKLLLVKSMLKDANDLDETERCTLAMLTTASAPSTPVRPSRKASSSRAETDHEIDGSTLPNNIVSSQMVQTEVIAHQTDEYATRPAKSFGPANCGNCLRLQAELEDLREQTWKLRETISVLTQELGNVRAQPEVTENAVASADVQLQAALMEKDRECQQIVENMQEKLRDERKEMEREKKLLEAQLVDLTRGLLDSQDRLQETSSVTGAKDSEENLLSRSAVARPGHHVQSACDNGAAKGGDEVVGDVCVKCGIKLLQDTGDGGGESESGGQWWMAVIEEAPGHGQTGASMPSSALLRAGWVLPLDRYRLSGFRINVSTCSLVDQSRLLDHALQSRAHATLLLRM